MTVHVITGGAGFVAANLIRRLLERGKHVVAFDDLSRGRRAHWDQFADCKEFEAEVFDVNDLALFRKAMSTRLKPGQSIEIWHLAANSDIPAGLADPTIDLDRTFMTTFNALIIAKEFKVQTFHFASSSAIYGDLGDQLIHENIGPLEPISNYGAMKLASEAQIRSAVESFLPRSNIFRFPNVVGTPATHGVILDFIRKLKINSACLEVLGNGTQRKAYLHVDDLVNAMLFVADNVEEPYNVFNVGPNDDGIYVREIAEIVRSRVAPSATISYGSDNRGWIGDVPRFRYAIDRLSKFGWKPSFTSRDAVLKAVDQIADEEHKGQS